MSLGEDIRLEVPPEALDGWATVSIRPVAPGVAPPGVQGMTAVSAAYDVTGVSRFQLPASLTMRISEQPPDPGVVFIAYEDNVTRSWMPIRVSAVTDRAVTVEIRHLTRFQAFMGGCLDSPRQFSLTARKDAYVSWAIGHLEEPSWRETVSTLCRRGFNRLLANAGTIVTEPDLHAELGYPPEEIAERFAELRLVDGGCGELGVNVEAWLNAGGDGCATPGTSCANGEGETYGMRLARYLYAAPDEERQSRKEAIGRLVATVGTILTGPGAASGIHLNFELRDTHCAAAGVPRRTCVTGFPRDFADIVDIAIRQNEALAITVSGMPTWDAEQLAAFGNADFVVFQAYNWGTSVLPPLYRWQIASAALDIAATPNPQRYLFALPAFGANSILGAHHPSVENLMNAAAGLSCVPLEQLGGAVIYDIIGLQNGVLLGDPPADPYPITEDSLVAVDSLFRGCSGGSCSSDEPPGCTCLVGTSWCVSSTVRRVCAASDPLNGCGEWIDEDCSFGCDIDRCVECPTICMEGDRMCMGSTRDAVCRADPETGCLVWDGPNECDHGAQCRRGGRCCRNMCALPTEGCSASGVPQACIEDEVTGCSAWRLGHACTAGRICSGGACVRPDSGVAPTGLDAGAPVDASTADSGLITDGSRTTDGISIPRDSGTTGTDVSLDGSGGTCGTGDRGCDGDDMCWNCEEDCGRCRGVANPCDTERQCERGLLCASGECSHPPLP
ncbi:MAG: hypothetical protein IT379_11925 [Deltaproteobacteria bacterium]|nr:hypothetical protein [Deltaproteobacteria bacterium]